MAGHLVPYLGIIHSSLDNLSCATTLRLTFPGKTCSVSFLSLARGAAQVKLAMLAEFKRHEKQAVKIVATNKTRACIAEAPFQTQMLPHLFC